MKALWTRIYIMNNGFSTEEREAIKHFDTTKVKLLLYELYA